jgi:hypothetical protein
MMRNAPTVYRVRATWHERTWVVRSPDVDGLLLHAHRFDEIAPVARNKIARLKEVHSSTIDVAVQPVSFADPELQWFVERALVSQDRANAMAAEAADRTLEAVDKLHDAGMDGVDVERLVRLTDTWKYDREMGRFGVAPLDDDPWLSSDNDDDWNPVDPWGPRWHWAQGPSFPARLLKALGDEVGGPAELAVLDDAALPDEAFAWDGIDVDVRPRVEEVVVLCDRACMELFDVEARTAARRLLAYLARRTPKVLLRGTAAGTAGAVCWIVGQANHLFDTKEPPRPKDLSAALGISNPSSRAHTLLKKAELADGWYSRVVLGSADFLVSAHRRRIIELRDQYTVTDANLDI